MDLQKHFKKLVETVENITQRNIRVEADKAWETSYFRKGCIALLTYFVAVLFMWSIGVQKPLLNALIPVLGFLLSTLSLPAIKQWWIQKYISEHSFHKSGRKIMEK